MPHVQHLLRKYSKKGSEKGTTFSKRPPGIQCFAIKALGYDLRKKKADKT